MEALSALFGADDRVGVSGGECMDGLGRLYCYLGLTTLRRLKALKLSSLFHLPFGDLLCIVVCFARLQPSPS